MIRRTIGTAKVREEPYQRYEVLQLVGYILHVTSSHPRSGIMRRQKYPLPPVTNQLKRSAYMPNALVSSCLLLTCSLNSSCICLFVHRVVQ